MPEQHSLALVPKISIWIHWENNRKTEHLGVFSMNANFLKCKSQWKWCISMKMFPINWEFSIWLAQCVAHLKKRCSCKAHIKHCLLNKFFPLKCAFKSSVSLTIWKRKTTEKHPFDYCIENQVFICASTSKGFSVTSFVSFSFGRLFYVCH